MRKLRKEERDELEAIVAKANRWIQHGVFVGGSVVIRGSEPEPEDMEDSDREQLIQSVDEQMDRLYPAFEPDIIYHMNDKEYFLPALKVLKFQDEKYFSPGYEVEWKDMCLKAECKAVGAYLQTNVKMITNLQGDVSFVTEPPDVSMGFRHHNAPDEYCDCGIYGSVNLEEIQYYLKSTNYFTLKLCIIEPYPDAKVVLCRKGWKSSSTFVSEIVGETISIDQASNLLSLAWKRTIDVWRVYENRQDS